MKLKTILSAGACLVSAITANAALVSPTDFSVKILDTIAGGNTGWTAMGANDYDTKLAWVDGSVSDAVTNYVTATNLAPAGFYNGTDTKFKRSAFGSTLPDESGSTTWLVSNTSSGTARASTIYNGQRYVTFSLTAVECELSITGFQWSFLGAKSNTPPETRSYARNRCKTKIILGTNL